MTDSSFLSLPSLAWLRVWILATVLALFGNVIFWDAVPGLNWGLWVTAVAGALCALIYFRDGRVGRPTMTASVWASVVAYGFAFTTREELEVFIVGASLVLLAIALMMEREPSFDALIPRTILLAPPQSVFWVLRGAGSAIAGTSTHVTSQRARPVIRGLLITLPVVVALILILANADPVFEWMRDGLTRLFPDIISPRSVFVAVLFVTTFGAYSAVVLATPKLPIPMPTGARVISIGTTERRMLLTSVAAIIWLFVASACISLWLNPAATTGSGVTYAEYARRGFAELAIAATLVIGVVLASDHARVYTRELNDSYVRRSALAALIAVALMLGIAFTRVLQYEHAYGYTVRRLTAQAYMIGLACALVFAALNVIGTPHPGRFTRRTLTATLAVFVGMIYWNTEAWIVHRNIDRYLESGKLDTNYIASLSADGVPALVARTQDLRPAERIIVMNELQCKFPSLKPDQVRWFEWNRRAANANSALRRIARTGCSRTPPVAPTP